MKAPRVYHREPLQVGRDVTLAQAAAHHLARVLRMRPGDAVVLFDGNGGECPGILTCVDRSVVRARLERHEPIDRESVLAIGLAQVVSAGERMDVTIQKAVELGVRWVQPLTSRRAKVRLSDERAEKRVAHWQRVAEAACEQCGRNRVPRIEPVREYLAWLGELPAAGERLLLDPEGPRRLSEAARPSGEVILLAGGESGFERDEAVAACRYGFVPVRLGPRVLRTETAGLAALAAMQALWGDF